MNKLQCPMCGNETEHFDDYDMTYTILNKLTRLLYKDAICQACKSDVRHRFVFRFLQDKTQIFNERIKVLHFAPEYWLANVFLKTDIDYIPVDINCERFQHFDVGYTDITGIPFEDNSFDAIILVHVLEHIPDYEMAIKELFRVLKPGAWVLLSVPTHEKPTESGLHMTPAERKNMYGLEDHFHLFGPDLKDKLEAAKFNTGIFVPEDISGNWYNRSIDKGYRPSDKYIFFSQKPKNFNTTYQKLKKDELIELLSEKEELCNIYRESIKAITQMKNNYKIEFNKIQANLNLKNEKNKTNPLLSIIMVTYNAEKDVENTLNSIVEQTFKNYEIIVIDGDSKDKTLEILEKYKTRFAYFVSEPDQGIYDAMNKGIVAASGKYVQFLNAGDYFIDANVLSSVFGQVVGTPDLIYGDINILHEDGRVQYQPASSFTLDNLQRIGTGVICHQAMFVLRERVPVYDLKYPYKAELNWYFDIVEKNKFSFQHCKTPIVYYSLGGWGYQNLFKNRIDWLRVIFNRYGLKTIIKSRLLIFLYKNSYNRYPFLAKIHPIVVVPIKILRKFKKLLMVKG